MTILALLDVLALLAVLAELTVLASMAEMYNSCIDCTGFMAVVA